MAGYYIPLVGTPQIGDSGGGGGGGGGSSNVLVVTDNAGTLDKTWQEIHDAVEAGQVVVFQQALDNALTLYGFAGIEADTGYYAVYLYNFGNSTKASYVTNSASGYPALSIG